MKTIIEKYKNSMVYIFEIKYKISECEARKLIKEFDFDDVLKSCNYIALHDDPEVWVDAIYKWANRNENEIMSNTKDLVGKSLVENLKECAEKFTEWQSATQNILNGCESLKKMGNLVEEVNASLTELEKKK